MFRILLDRTYRHLFFAQVVALLGTGLITVALGLLAFDLAGQNASLVLGTIFAIKMVAYVLIAPIAGAFADRIHRRTFLVFLDLLRAGVVVALPFTSQVWQVYMLIFLLQAASAAFTPVFQATIPDVLPEEDRYTRALSLSRVAYELENILSPSLAAVLLMLMPTEALFAGTLLGYLGSALLVVTVTLPHPEPAQRQPVLARSILGIQSYLATPRLRGLLGLNLVVASVGAMVLVNSVVLVRGNLGMDEAALGWTMACFGAGSLAAALVLPRILDTYRDRSTMLFGAVLMILPLVGFAVIAQTKEPSWTEILILWALIGLGYSTVLTPSGRLLKRSAHSHDRPLLFSAQFALSHACWLLTYPLSGWLMTMFGPMWAALGLVVLALTGLGFALRFWPVDTPAEIEHTHDNLPLDHPHLQGLRRHKHPLIIDAHHSHWGSRF
jgi:MFS family permease